MLWGAGGGACRSDYRNYGKVSSSCCCIKLKPSNRSLVFKRVGGSKRSTVSAIVFTHSDQTTLLRLWKSISPLPVSQIWYAYLSMLYPDVLPPIYFGVLLDFASDLLAEICHNQYQFTVCQLLVHLGSMYASSVTYRAPYCCENLGMICETEGVANSNWWRGD